MSRPNSINLRHLIAFLFVFVLFVSGCNLPGSAPAASGLTTQIISPEDGAQLAVGEMVNIHTTIADSGGAAAASLLVNGEVQRDDLFSTPMHQGKLFQPWQPSEPGTYTLQVRLSTGGSGVSESNIVTVYVGGEVQPKAENSLTPTIPTQETVEDEKMEITLTPTESFTSTPTTPTTTSTFTLTATITLTPTLGAPTFTADQSSNCRVGPSSSLYATRASINKGDTVPITGKSSAEWGLWWVVEVNGTNCWVYSELGSAQGDLENVPIVPAPPLPTDTPSPTPVPLTAPNPNSPTGTLNCADASGGVTLNWSAITHPNGIDHYEWTLEGPISDSGSTGNTQASTTTLSCAGANFQWRVRAVDGQGNVGPWSGYATFTVP